MNGHRVQRHHRRLVLRVGCWRDFLLRDERKIGSTIKLNTLLSLRSTQALVGEHFKDSAYLLVHVISDIFNIYIILYLIYIYIHLIKILILLISHKKISHTDPHEIQKTLLASSY